MMESEKNFKQTEVAPYPRKANFILKKKKASHFAHFDKLLNSRPKSARWGFLKLFWLIVPLFIYFCSYQGPWLDQSS